LEVWSRLEGYPLFYERGPHLDMVAWVIAALALLLSLGVGTVRWGHRRLRPFRPALGFIQPNAVHSRRRVLLVGCLRIIGGGIVLLAVMFFLRLKSWFASNACFIRELCRTGFQRTGGRSLICLKRAKSTTKQISWWILWGPLSSLSARWHLRSIGFFAVFGLSSALSASALVRVPRRNLASLLRFAGA